jgi:hypothetical protein
LFTRLLRAAAAAASQDNDGPMMERPAGIVARFTYAPKPDGKAAAAE